jgi:hypothetical protein
MDLADLKNSPEIRESATYKFFLVVVNVFDRFCYARNLRTKEPKEVRTALASIISSLPAKKKDPSDSLGQRQRIPRANGGPAT